MKYSTKLSTFNLNGLETSTKMSRKKKKTATIVIDKSVMLCRCGPLLFLKMSRCLTKMKMSLLALEYISVCSWTVSGMGCNVCLCWLHCYLSVHTAAVPDFINVR